MTFCIIICSASTFSANAVMAEENDTVIEATVNLGNENEPQPMATSGCENDYHHIFDNPQHNLAPFLNSYGEIKRLHMVLYCQLDSLM